MNKKQIFIILLVFFLVASIFLLPHSVYADTAPTLNSGLVLYLPFDEGGGSVAIDHSGYNHHGQITSATWTNGKYDKSLSCTYGASNVVTDLVLSNETTISFWLNNTDYLSVYWIEMTNVFFEHTANRRLYVNGESDYFEVDWSGLNNTWTHFVWVGNATDDNNSVLYVNNVPYNIVIQTGGTLTNSSFSLGNINGIFDDVRVYNRTLSQSEITYLFENPPIAKTISLLSYGSGSIFPLAGDHQYNVSDTVTLTAIPANSNWVFMGWLQNGTLITDDSPYNYTVTDNYVLTAIFYDPTTKPGVLTGEDAVGLAVVALALAVALPMAFVVYKKKQND